MTDKAEALKLAVGFLGAVFWAFVATAVYTGYQHGIDYAILNLVIAVIVRQVRNEVAAFGLFGMLMEPLADAAAAAVRKLEEVKAKQAKAKRRRAVPAEDSDPFGTDPFPEDDR